MNLFRSEEHARKWSGFKPDTEEGIITLPELAHLFSGDLFRRRLDPDYVSHYREYIGGFAAAVGELGKIRPFWSPQPRS
jgi:hypothetical protein